MTGFSARPGETPIQWYDRLKAEYTRSHLSFNLAARLGPPEPQYPAILLRTMSEHYGLKVTHMGDDGEMFVLGHHTDVKRVAAALNAEERRVGGRDRDWHGCNDYAEFAGSLQQRWAVCDEVNVLEDEWWVDPYQKPSAEGAFPITLLPR